MATLTRAGIEAALVPEFRGRLTFASFSTVTDGTNPNLNGPIRRAVRWLGGDTADALIAADSDLSGFTGWSVEKLMDVIRLELLKDILHSCAKWDFKVGKGEQSIGKFLAQIAADIKQLQDVINSPYGPDVPQSAVGRMPEPRHGVDGLPPPRVGYWGEYGRDDRGWTCH